MNQGFTLIELLVVVIIIGILSAIALPQYQTAVERSRATEALTQMNAIRTSAERYHSQHEAWPTSFSQLDVDIPLISTSTYGGKNFTVTFATTNCLDGVGEFCIHASRRRDTHSYDLWTLVTENSNGTYSAVRKCRTSPTDTEAQNYCNAITGGKNDNF